MRFEYFTSKTGRASIGVQFDGEDDYAGYINWDYSEDGSLWITFLYMDKKHRGSPAAMMLLRKFREHIRSFPSAPSSFYAHISSLGVLKLCKRVFGKPLSEVIAEGLMDISHLPKKAQEYKCEDGTDSVTCPITYQVQFSLV